VAWVKRLSPDKIGRKLSSQRTKGILVDLRTNRSENHDMRPRATKVEEVAKKSCQPVGTYYVSKRIRIGNKGDLVTKHLLR
jgi:hypothetical protein